MWIWNFSCSFLALYLEYNIDSLNANLKKKKFFLCPNHIQSRSPPFTSEPWHFKEANLKFYYALLLIEWKFQQMFKLVNASHNFYILYLCQLLKLLQEKII